MTETWRVRFPVTSAVQDRLQRKVAEDGLSSLCAPERVLLTVTSMWSATARSDLHAWFSQSAGDRIGDAIHALNAVGAYRLASIVGTQADYIASRDSAVFFQLVADTMMRCEDPLETLVADYAAKFQDGIELQNAPVVAQVSGTQLAGSGDRLSLHDELDDLLENYRRLGDTLTGRITAQGIDLRSFVVLGFIGESAPQAIDALALLLDLSLSTTRRCIEALAAQGLVRTTAGATPSATTVQITAKGNRFLDGAKQGASSED